MRFTGDDDYLRQWEAVLRDRARGAVAAFAAIDGVAGLIVGGSLGGGTPWPLSDIDILPIYEDDRAERAAEAIARRREALIARWTGEGWHTGLDVGTLAFTSREVGAVVHADPAEALRALHDDRWYHSLDKGYRGSAAYDPGGLASALARWFTATRFAPAVVAFRLERQRRRVLQAHSDLLGHIANRDAAVATSALRAGVEALRVLLLEGWGERDNSFARLGTRFERAARAKGREDLIATLNDLNGLNDRSVLARLRAAPASVRRRHERSWRARDFIGEDVTPVQDARDVLRVSSYYALREAGDAPYPAWLAVETDFAALQRKAATLSQVLEENAPSGQSASAGPRAG